MSIIYQPERTTYEGPSCIIDELELVGWTRFSQAGGLEIQQHPSYEICYIVQGQVTWMLGSTAYDINRGDLFITKPRQLHSGFNEMMHPCELRWLQVYIPENNAALPGLSLSETNQLRHDLQSIRYPCFPGTTAIKRNLTRMLAEHQTPSPYAPLLVRSYLHQILILVIQAHTAYQRTQTNQSAALSPPIHRAAQWMKAHLSEAYQVEDLAQMVTLSVSQFHKQFLAETGLTPASYRTRQRLLQAKQWLSEGDRPILEIALDLGFSTAQYFATVFKKYEGITPSEYRARQNQNHKYT